MKEIDVAFSKTTKLLFGRGLSPLDKYGDWIASRLPKGSMRESCINRRMVCVPSHSLFCHVPKERVAGLDSLEILSNKKISLSDGESVKSLSGKLSEIAFYICELAEGRNANVEESAIYNDLYDAYRVIDCFYSKRIAYDFFADYNEATFGCCKNFNSKFSIHCYNSHNVNLGFEVDACSNCSNIMFCHNCEHIFDSLFCFNSKNKRYAVGNTVVGRENFLRIKEIFSEYVLANLEKNSALPLNIFNLACAELPLLK